MFGVVDNLVTCNKSAFPMSRLGFATSLMGSPATKLIFFSAACRNERGYDTTHGVVPGMKANLAHCHAAVQPLMVCWFLSI